MARVAVQARIDEKSGDWSLLYSAGEQTSLRVPKDGFYKLFDEIMERKKRRRTSKQDDGHGIPYTGSMDNEIGKSGHSRGRGRKENGQMAMVARNGDQLRRGKELYRDPTAAQSPERGRKANPVRDVVVSKKFEVDFRGGSAPVSPSSSSPSPERSNVRPSHDIPPHEYRGLLRTKFNAIVSRALVPATPSSTEDRSELSSQYPVIDGVVDDFMIHDNGRAISITSLPVYIDGVVCGGSGVPHNVYLTGIIDHDKPVKSRVEMWRLILHQGSRPSFLLKTKKFGWLGLLNSGASYAKIMSEAYTLAHFLQFVKQHPFATVASAEEYIVKECRMAGENPSLDKLTRNLKVIRSFAEEDPDIERASVLRKIFPNLFSKEPRVRGEPGKHKTGSAQRLKLTTGSRGKAPKYKHADIESRELLKEVQLQTFSPAELEVEDPPICVLCDDGGDLIYCEGPCQRHFHPTEGSGEASFCQTLSLSKADVKEIGKYFCKNCEHSEHQCFVCGELGSSSPVSHGVQEVQCCDVPFCKRFYHLECVTEMLALTVDWRALVDEIRSGRKKLYCPRHCCSLCGKAESESPGLLVQCRRCPKAWHKSCLTDFSRSGELETTPIWRHHDREFIYCRNHQILPDLQTPARDFVKFPPAQEKHQMMVKIGFKRLVRVRQ